MACGGCAKKRAANKPAERDQKLNFMVGYESLPPNQIKGRLELFKRRYCAGCATRYDCDINMYNSCQKRLI
jgi:hypothetical protein